MSEHEKHGHPSGHDSHENHGHTDAHSGHAGHDAKAKGHGSEPASHAHAGHGGHGKKPGNILAAIAVLLLLIAILAVRESESAKLANPVLDVTPEPDDAIPTDVSSILSSLETYHGKVVKLQGVLGFKGGDTRAKNLELFDENRRSMRMNITGFDFPRVVRYEVLARVDSSNPADPFLNVLKIEPTYETTVGS